MVRSLKSARSQTLHPTQVYLAYVWFWHTSSATFLVLLLALSSGYTITRITLEGGHMPKVVLIPSILFIAGVVGGWRARGRAHGGRGARGVLHVASSWAGGGLCAEVCPLVLPCVWVWGCCLGVCLCMGTWAACL